MSRETLGLSFAFVALALTAPSSQAPSRPNVVMFIMDDLGYGDVGSYGVPDAKTPNIDRLAREGVKFTDFYANHANCSPTRAAFISGRYQQRHGIESPLAHDDTRHLPPSETSLPRLLKNAGYATGLFGKWHLGAETSSGPNRHGFDEFWGFRRGAVDYYTHNVVTIAAVKLDAPIHDLYHNEEPTTSTAYLTDDITRRAEAFIEQRANGPFFVEVAYNATHWPFQRPDLPEGKRGWEHYRESGTRADYVAMLERADQGIGRILDALDRLKLARNTLVMFTSDNGGEWLSRNAPLFHRKSTLWEGGIRVPLLLRWPARLQAGTDVVAGRHHDGPHCVDPRSCGRTTAARLSPGRRRSHRAAAERHDSGENALLANASGARCDRHAAGDAARGAAWRLEIPRRPRTVPALRSPHRSGRAA